MSNYWFKLEISGKTAELNARIVFGPKGELLTAEWFCLPGGFFPIAHGTVYWTSSQLGLYNLQPKPGDMFPPADATRYARLALPPDSDGLDTMTAGTTGGLYVGLETGAWTFLRKTG